MSLADSRPDSSLTFIGTATTIVRLGGQSWCLARGDQRLTVTAVPEHYGPAGVHRLLPPVRGSVVELRRPGEPDLQVYITGDTLNRPMLREISERYADAVRTVQRDQTVELVRDAAGVSPRGVGKD